MGRKMIKMMMITFSCVLYGVGISSFVEPNQLAPGGFTGIAVIISRLVPIDTGNLYLFMNVPVMILSVKKFGWKFTASTLYAIVMVSLSTNLFSKLSPVTNEPLLGAVFGGALIAVGMGMVLRFGATTGGMDIIIKCLRLKFPHLRTGTLILLLDSVIILLSGFVFGNADSVLFSVLAIVTTAYVLDIVLYGRDEAKLIYIISDRYQVITKRILEDVGVGVTHLEGSGAYAKKEKNVILCVVRKQNAYKIEEVVRQEDANAFMIVSRATEIYGEGYKSYFGEVL